MSIDLIQGAKTPRGYLIGVNGDDLPRIRKCLNKRADQELRDQFKDPPWPGIVIKAKDEEAARGIEIQSFLHPDDLPIYIVCGKGASRRFKADVSHNPDKVREIAMLLVSDRITRQGFSDVRSVVDEAEARLENDDSEPLAGVGALVEDFEYIADLCSGALKAFNDEITAYCKNARIPRPS